MVEKSLMNNRLSTFISHLLEIAFLWFLVFLPFLFRQFFEKLHILDEIGSIQDDYYVFLMFLFFSILVTGLLIISRITPGFLSFMTVALAFFGAWLYWFVIRKTLPVYHDIASDAIPGLLPQRFLIPTMMILVRWFLEYLVPFLAGLFAVRRGFRWWKFFTGVFAAKVIILGLINLKIAPLQFLFSVQTLSLVILYAAMLRLPLQRKALEKLCGFSLKRESTDKSISAKEAFSAILGYGTIIIIILLIFFLTVHTYHFNKAKSIISGPGPEPFPRSPAMKNAYPIFSELFTKKHSPGISSRMDEIVPQYENIIRPEFSENPKDIWKDIDETEFQEELKRLSPWIEVMEKALDADYCVYYHPEKRVSPYYSNFRDAAAALSLRTLYNMQMNSPDAAIDDIETILHTAWLLNTEGDIVKRMIGTSLRVIGLNSARLFYLKFRDNPEQITRLHKMLTGNEHKIRLNFDIQEIMLHEPGLKRFVPMYEIITPGVRRAYNNYYIPWVWFDQIILVMALDHYQKDTGKYPESLSELSPGYLDEIPKDPHKGKSYLYEHGNGVITLESQYLKSLENVDYNYSGKIIIQEKDDSDSL